MSKPKLKPDQSSVDQLSSWSWDFLNQTFLSLKHKKPKLYLFLSRESEGSLSKRTSEEIDFVRQIQMGGGGVVLHQPPLLGYVTRLDQVVEETAHLYSLCLQGTPPPPENREHEYRMSLLHETFGSFVQNILSPNFRGKSLVGRDRFWNRIHRDAEKLGLKLAARFLDEEVSESQLSAWLRMNWHSENLSKSSCLKLTQLADIRI